MLADYRVDKKKIGQCPKDRCVQGNFWWEQGQCSCWVQCRLSFIWFMNFSSPWGHVTCKYHMWLFILMKRVGASVKTCKIDHVGNNPSEIMATANPLIITGFEKKKKPETACNGCFHSVVLFCVWQEKKKMCWKLLIIQKQLPGNQSKGNLDF